MQIYLVRHGETTGDLEDRYGGSIKCILKFLGQPLADKIDDGGIYPSGWVYPGRGFCLSELNNGLILF